MNFEEKKDILEMFKEYPELIAAYTPTSIMVSLLLKDGKDPEDLFYKGKSTSEFIGYNFQDIDIRKFLLYGLYEIKKQEAGIPNEYSRKLVQMLTEKCKRYIKENDDITIYIGSVDNGKNEYTIEVVSSKVYVYGKKMPQREYKLLDNLNTLVSALSISDYDQIFKDEQLAQTAISSLTYNGLSDLGYNRGQIEKIANTGEGLEIDKINIARNALKLITTPGISNKVNETYLYAICAVRIYNTLVYATDNNIMELGIDGLIEVNDLLHKLINCVTASKTNFKISYDDEQKESISEDFRKRVEDTIDKLGQNFINKNPIQIYNPEIIRLLKRENAIKLTEQIDEDAKCAYMFSVYQAGKISFEEFETFVQSKGEDLDRYREYALWFKLNNKYIVLEKIINKHGLEPSQLRSEDSIDDEEYKPNDEGFIDIYERLRDPKILFSKPLNQEGIWQILNESMADYYILKALDEITKNSEFSEIARNDIEVLKKKNLISQDTMQRVIYRYTKSIDLLEDLFGKEKIQSLYAIKDLVNSFYMTYVLENKSSLSEEEKEHLKISTQMYIAQKTLFDRYGFVHELSKTDELLDEFDDLVFDDNILGAIHKNGLITINTLYELNSKLAVELLLSGELEDSEAKYVIDRSDVVLGAGDIIRFEEAGIINKKQILDLYMKGRCTLDSLKAFAEGNELASVFDDKTLISKIKQIALVTNGKYREDYARYVDAYTAFVGMPSEETQMREYKQIGGKNARVSDLLDMYSRGLINIDVLDSDKDNALIAQMIKAGVLRSGDEERLFRDDSMTGKKYLRLASVLDNYGLNEDQKINLLAGVYKDSDPISVQRVKFLSQYLEYAVEERESNRGNRTSYKRYSTNGTHKEAGKEERSSEQEVFTFGRKFKAFRYIDPNHEHMKASGSYIVYFKNYNAVVVEELYRSSVSGNNLDTKYATYIITDDAFKGTNIKGNNIYEKVQNYCLSINRNGTLSVDWPGITQLYREHTPGVTKCLHTTEDRWKEKLKTKLELITKKPKKTKTLTIDIDDKQQESEDIDIDD